MGFMGGLLLWGSADVVGELTTFLHLRFGLAEL
jgi:hypothetical protein